MVSRITAKKIKTARKIKLSLAWMTKHINMLHKSIKGARTAIRRTIWYAFWIFVTSVVIRVIKPAVLYLSMFEKEKVWMLANIPSRRLHAKPEEADAA